MKTKGRIIISALFCCLFFTASAETVNLLDALKKQMIRLKLQGAGRGHADYQSTHYGKCVKMKVKNLSAKTLELKLEAGYVLMASDTTTQDMLLTQDILVKVEAGKERDFLLYAMCSEKSNGSPNETVAYRIGAIGKGHLKELANIIFKRKIQNNTGQQAVWCLTDNNHISNIDGDTADTRILKEFVSKVTGQPLDKKAARKVIRRTTEYTYRFTGMFDFSIHEPNSKVTIRLKDSQGNIIRTWVDNQTYYKGHHVETYELSGNSLEPGEYFIELIIDGVTTMNRKIKIPTS